MWVRINKTQGTQDTPQTGGEGSGEGSEVVKSGFQITCYCVQSLLQTRAVPHAPQYTPMHARAHTHTHARTHTPTHTHIHTNTHTHTHQGGAGLRITCTHG